MKNDHSPSPLIPCLPPEPSRKLNPSAVSILKKPQPKGIPNGFRITSHSKESPYQDISREAEILSRNIFTDTLTKGSIFLPPLACRCSTEADEASEVSPVLVSGLNNWSIHVISTATSTIDKQSDHDVRPRTR